LVKLQASINIMYLKVHQSVTLYLLTYIKTD